MMKKIHPTVVDVEKESNVLDLEGYETKRKEYHKQVEEKKKLAQVPDISERKEFRYYMEPTALRNPVFLQVKGALEKNYIAVEDSFASSVSSIWKVALADPLDLVIPVDDKFDEDTIRCALYLAGTFYYKQSQRLDKVKLPVDLLLELIALTFQVGMDEVHGWLLTQIEPKLYWPFKDLLLLYNSPLHGKGVDFFSPIPKEKAAVKASSVDLFFGDDVLPPCKDEKKPTLPKKEIGWLKQKCGDLMVFDPQGILDHVLEKTSLSPQSNEADLLRVGMRIQKNQNCEDMDFAARFLDLLCMEVDLRGWEELLKKEQWVREFVIKTYKARNLKPLYWKLVVNACNKKFHEGIAHRPLDSEMTFVKKLVGV